MSNAAEAGQDRIWGRVPPEVLQRAVDANSELRAPLQAIMGFAELLKTEARPDVVAAHARDIQSAAESISAILDRSLAQAGAEDTPSTAGELTDVWSLGDACMSLIGPASLSKNLRTAFELDQDVPREIVLERQPISRAISNLLGNAVKHTDQGEIRLRISRVTNNLRVSVSDTGSGVPTDRSDPLFQNVSQVTASEKETESSGLGLAATKDLIERMNGQIGFENHADRGTTFWFEIPVEWELRQVATDPKISGTNEPIAQSDEQLAETRILLADDLDLNRKLIADMLGTDGHVVDCVADGAEAVKAAAERRYDVILMDMIMPGMDGIAATREIRKLPAPACDVPILALTAHTFKDQLQSCLTAGMNATLTKPMSLEALTSAVSSWTRGRKAA